MTCPEQEAVLRFLLDPASHDEAAGPTVLHETHISWVVLAGPFAYKMKKAVRLPFLDHSTVALRRHLCEEELRLNRRWAPSLYLEVVSVCEEEGCLRFASSGDGEPVLRMRRVSAEASLESLVRGGAWRPGHIDALVERLLEAEASAERSDAQESGSAGAVREQVLENFESTRPFVGELISASKFEATRCAQLAFLALKADVFEKRIRGGWVRDGHGDLRAEHIVYLPACEVLDCIEFSQALRVIDVAADLAFLRMDLEFLGAQEASHRLIDRYRECSGDHGVAEVLEFYTSYRAWVRGKVACIKRSQLDPEDPETEVLTRRARRYFELAHFHTLLFQKPLLVSVGGLPGTGKSTLARQLASVLGAEHLSSDAVRKELAGGNSGKLYSSEHTEATYRELLERAAVSLEAGTWVILDATFTDPRQRSHLKDLANRLAVPHAHFECQVPRETAHARIRARAAAGVDLSDATPAVHDRMESYHGAGTMRAGHAIDTSGSPAEALAGALSVLTAYANTSRP